MELDSSTVALAVMIGLTRLDAVLGLGDRLWGRVQGIKAADLDRAHRIVAEEEREDRLAQLAEVHEPLLAIAQRAEQISLAVGVNGKPLHDRLTEFAGELRTVKGDVGVIKEQLATGSDWMRTHEALHAAVAEGERR